MKTFLTALLASLTMFGCSTSNGHFQQAYHLGYKAGYEKAQQEMWAQWLRDSWQQAEAENL